MTASTISQKKSNKQHMLDHCYFYGNDKLSEVPTGHILV